jgi:hypothetical protein
MTETVWKQRPLFCKWLKETQAKLGASSYDAVASLLEIRSGTLYSYRAKNAGKPSDAVLKKLGDFLGYDYRALIDGHPESMNHFQLIPDSIIRIPLLSIRPSLGNIGDIVELDEKPRGVVPFDEYWIYRILRKTPEKLKLYNIDGNSLEPMFSQNDMVMVDIGAWESGYKDGIWLLKTEGSLLLKRVQKISDKRYRAYSDNPRFGSLTLSDSVDFKGLVVWGSKLY